MTRHRHSWGRHHRLPQAEAAPSGPSAAVRGVTVHRGARQVLAGVSLEVRAGEVLALVGPNGAGKTTLLGVLAGDTAIDAGEVDICGAPLQSWTPMELAWRRAVLPQQSMLSFPFPVRDVVAMGRAPWARTDFAESDDAVIADAMRRTTSDELADRHFTSLSGGERARVALARVLAQEAPVLLLDEPTAAMDLHHQELVLRIAVEQARRGDAVVVVLHDLGVAAAYADQVAVLADGRLVAHGTPDEVMREDLLSEVYSYPVEVLRHPRTGDLMVLPRR